MSQIFVLVIAIAVAVASVLWKAFVASKLIAWYLVPAFPWTAALDMHLLAGVLCLYKLFTTAKFNASATVEDALAELIVDVLFGPAIVLLLGWLLL